jgi:hypothetical protein
MAALDTVGQVVKESRRLLQDDVVPYRYSDGDLVDTLNIAMLETRRLRADLFLPGRFAIPFYDTAGTVNMAATIPIEPMYRQVFVYYIVGRIELRDDEQTQDSRASALFNKFINQLLTIAA